MLKRLFFNNMIRFLSIHIMKCITTSILVTSFNHMCRYTIIHTRIWQRGVTFFLKCKRHTTTKTNYTCNTNFQSVAKRIEHRQLLYTALFVRSIQSIMVVRFLLYDRQTTSANVLPISPAAAKKAETRWQSRITKSSSTMQNRDNFFNSQQSAIIAACSCNYHWANYAVLKLVKTAICIYLHLLLLHFSYTCQYTM